jgi:DTW domain-containing protein
LRCMRPASACLCPTRPPMETRTRVVLLMHSKEYRRERTGTGRLACLNLANSEIVPGLAFDDHARVRALLDDPGLYSALLYPGQNSLDLGAPEGAETLIREARGRRLVVFLVDATWACSKSVLRASPGIASLPRLSIKPRERSRWVIKRQPRDCCLSTIEAIHELLAALEAARLDSYPDKERLLAAFAAMQDYQIERAETAGRARYLERPRRAGRSEP